MIYYVEKEAKNAQDKDCFFCGQDNIRKAETAHFIIY